MKESKANVSRRDFMRSSAATAAAGAAAAAAGQSILSCAGASTANAAEAQPAAKPSPTTPAKPLPSIQLGPHRVSRMVAGANPLSGYSYQGAHATNCMKEYFTPEQRVEFLLSCERAGITTHQFSNYKDSDYIRAARDRGSKMSFFGLHSDVAAVKDAIKAVQPIALVHHGGATDTKFAQGKHQQVHDFVKGVHDAGIMAGVSAHNPDCIKRIADEGWDVDFFMTCFYFITRERIPGAMDKVPPVCTLDMTHYTWYKDDPERMTAVVRQVKQPCFGFKILAAGRACLNERRVREAFKIAFSSIKPIDGVIVGMFPRYVDEIQFNVEAAHSYAQIPKAEPRTS